MTAPPKSESSSKDDDQINLPYGLFFVFLLFYTAIEGVVFVNRDNWHLANKILVPILLTLTLVKFILVIGWFLYRRGETGWFGKIMIVSLVTGGASGLILHLLV